jgi:hypothetical protein
MRIEPENTAEPGVSTAISASAFKLSKGICTPGVLTPAFGATGAAAAFEFFADFLGSSAPDAMMLRPQTAAISRRMSPLLNDDRILTGEGATRRLEIEYTAPRR